jgi:hypothetical protein
LARLFTSIAISWLFCMLAASPLVANGSISVVRPTLKAATLMEGDEPYGAMFWDSEARLWLAGRKFVWGWQVKDQSVLRFPHSISPVGEIYSDAIHTSDTKIFLHRNNNVQIIEKDTGYHYASKLTLPSECRQMNFVDSSDGIILVGRCGAWFFDSGGEILSHVAFHGDFQGFANFVYEPECRCFFATKHMEVVRIEATETLAKQTIMYRAKSKLLGLVKTGDTLVGWSPYAVMVLRPGSLDRLQVIPVARQKKIGSAVFSDRLHAYLMDQGQLEIMDPFKGGRVETRIDMQASNKIRLLPSKDAKYLAMIGHGHPQVFKLNLSYAKSKTFK